MIKVNPKKYITTLNEIAQFIYDNVEEDISLDGLADRFSISKYHLNRLFFAQIGLTLGEFIQRRRMELAYELLRNTDISVIDVSLRVGYDSSAAFSRAFKKLFSLEPNKVKLKQAPKFALANLVKKNDRPKLLAEIVDLPEQHLIGLYGQGFHDQTYFKVAEKLYQQIANKLALTNGFDFNKHQLIGISIDSPWRTEQAESYFFAGIKGDINNNKNSQKFAKDNKPHLESYKLPAGTWARFSHKGPYNMIWQTILNVYAHWLHENDYTLRDCAVIQHYVNDIQCTPVSELLTHIYVPIEN